MSAELARLAALASDPVATLREILEIADDDEIHSVTAREMIGDRARAALDALDTTPASETA